MAFPISIIFPEHSQWYEVSMASGGGNITITGLETLKADVSSGAHIDYYGDPDNIRVDESRCLYSYNI